MRIQKKIEVYGDSVLKGIQVNPENKRYHIDNNIDIEGIEKAHSLSIKNFSKFGCTITKGFSLIKNRLGKGEVYCDAIVMDYGGNDCDFNWKEIAEKPDDDHLPNTPLDVFVDTYHKIICLLKENGIRPIMTNLPPIDAQRFFDWFCGGFCKMNILKWLGGVESIYNWQEKYSKAVEEVAAETDTLLVDIRGAFLRQGRIKRFLCEDGTHPNTEGQKIITEAFFKFIEQSKNQGKILI